MKSMLSGLFTITVKVLFLLTLISASSVSVMAVETETATVKSNSAKKAPLIISSQVKGSQEQPNIIYIMPWQGITNPISIDGNTHNIVLPHFAPINPKSFKKQARLFYKVNVKNQTQINKK